MMTVELQPYRAYKDSGVEWLGAVPAHWEVRRLRTVAEMRVSNVDKHSRDGERPIRLCNYVDVYKADRIQTEMPLMAATATSEEVERFRLLPGDVLITKDSEAWDDIGVPALVEGAADNTICGYHLALLRPFSGCVRGSFLFRAVQSSAVGYQFHVRANGVTRYGLTHNAIKSTWLPLPRPAEQAAIVRFLDHADRRIRRYIRAQQQLIVLLEEQKQAIIHQAVTGQIDVSTGKPYPAYKDSRVDWLGEVPEHWALDRIKRSTIGRKTGVWGGEAKEDDNDIPCVRVADFDRQRRRVELSDPTIRNVTQNERTGRVLRRGDLLLEKSGGGELQPVGCVVLYDDDRPAVCSNFVARMLIPPGMSSYFWLYFHAAAYALRLNTRSIKQTTGIQNIDQQQYFDEKAVFPPIDEQIQIAIFLDRADQRIRRYIRAKRQLIALLKEHKQAIVNQAVTGQIDVRGVAAGLPDDVDELEPFHETCAIDGEEAFSPDLDAVPKEADA